MSYTDLFEKNWLFIYLGVSALLAFIIIYFFPGIIVSFDTSCGNETTNFISKDAAIQYSEECVENMNKYINDTNSNIDNGLS